MSSYLKAKVLLQTVDSTRMEANVDLVNMTDTLRELPRSNIVWLNGEEAIFTGDQCSHKRVKSAQW